MKKQPFRPLLPAFFIACIAAAATAGPVGVTVNGDMLDSAGSSGDGWAYASPTLTLSGAGPFTIAGTNNMRQVMIAVPQEVTNTVTLVDLKLWATGATQGVFVLETNACVTLLLAGTSTLDSSYAGIEVPPGASLSITNAPGDEAAALVVKGSRGAGIGGRSSSACGTVTISGGAVKATGGNNSAGIGGGEGATCDGGTVTISGGTVTASGSGYAAGIGGGGAYQAIGGAGGVVTITGGEVTATGGGYGAGIGGGSGGDGGTVTISGGTISATGGANGGTGIGGGNGGNGGTVEISGGDVHAMGNSNATGIGGGNGGHGGTVTISGGTVTATGNYYAAGIGGGNSGTGGVVNVSGGTVTATGGSQGGAGIGGGGSFSSDGGAGGTVTISGGAVIAAGGRCAAGIGGGGRGGAGPVVEISDGTVVATGGQRAPGIGGGGGDGYRDGGAGGEVTISGGRVTATGGFYRDNNNYYYGAAGIGGGYRGAGAILKISGGTVFATGAGGGEDIGAGQQCTGFGTNLFTGGSIRLANSAISPVPSNAAARVACVMAGGFAPGGAVEVGPLLSGAEPYGANDIVADDDGTIYLWLPDGVHAFTANGRACTGSVTNGVGPVGVTVNGEEVAFGSTNAVAGWSYAPADRVLTLSGAGPFTLAGTNMVGAVSVVLPDRTTNSVTLANLNLRVTGTGRSAFSMGKWSRASLCLAGANALVSGEHRAGIEVLANQTLCITNAPGDDAATLTATGGDYAAGIGGSFRNAGGTVEIAGGNVTAAGGYRGAGVGGGDRGTGGALTLSGGALTATGGENGAGIGGGCQGSSGNAVIDISGGTVTAQGGYRGAGIGSGVNGVFKGTLTISGGHVTATGGADAAGIGGGGNAYNSTVTMTVSGGTVVAQGGTAGAGIGGGLSNSGLALTVSGGVITATGGDGGAGIGGGGGNTGGKGGSLTVSGGTIFATGVGGADIGPGAKASDSGANTFTGGSIRLANDTIALAPSNGTERIWCVTFPVFAPDAAVPEFEGLPEGYGTDDLFADENGTVYLWLPNGDYVFIVNGVPYVATVANADAAATTHYFAIAAFELADNTATFTLAERLPPDLFDAWTNTVTAFEVQYCTNLTEAAWTTLPGTVRDGMTLTVPFATDEPRVFLRVLAQ
ncbi:MAG: beta strand repeat-containing protein [Kiritimatiellia bacterium]